MRKHLLMMIALLCMVAQGALAATEGTWDSYRDTSWGADYETANSFTISTAEALAQFAYMVNNGQTFKEKTVAISQDIDLSGHYWVPIGKERDSHKTFAGSFDGQGHTIKSLETTFTRQDEQNNASGWYMGLFGDIWADGTIVKSVCLAESEITGYKYVGGIVGNNEGATISDCYVADVRFVPTCDNAERVGGIAGDNGPGGTIDHCYSAFHVRGNDYSDNLSICGGIAGYNNGTISYSFFIANELYGKEYVGSIAGNNYDEATLTQNYYYNGRGIKGVGIRDSNIGKDIEDGTSAAKKLSFVDEGFSLDVQKSHDGIIKTFNYDKLILYKDNYYACTGTEVKFTHTLPAPGYDYDIVLSDNTASIDPGVGEAWVKIGDNDLKVSFTSEKAFEGEGTEASPFLIQSLDDMNKLSKISNGVLAINFDNLYFKLTADLTYTGTDNYIPVSYLRSYQYENARYFGGHFDGNGHTISGIDVTNTGIVENNEVALGVFALAKGGSVKNLTVSNSTFKGVMHVGAIVGEMRQETIENCHATNTVSIQSYSEYKTVQVAGGIVGYAYYNSTINGSTSAATFGKCYSATGGIIGSMYNSTMQDCLYLGDAEVFNTSHSITSFGSLAGAASSCTLQNNLYDANKVTLKAIGDKDESAAAEDQDGANGAYIINIVQPTHYGNELDILEMGNTQTTAYTAFENAPAITAYEGILNYDGKYYAKAGADVTFNTTNDKYNSSLKVEDAETTGNSFTMPEKDVNVTATNIGRKEWGGSGTKEDPFTIPDVAALNALAEEVSNSSREEEAFKNTYFKMTNDIDYSGEPLDKDNGQSNFTPIGFMTTNSDGRVFCGVFDGGGHTISGITLGKPSDDRATQGVFGLVSGTSEGPAVKNLTLANSTITVADNIIAGGISAFAYVYSSIDSCNVTNTVTFDIQSTTPDKVSVGGIVGVAGAQVSTISNCFCNANFNLAAGAQAYNVGAIIGQNGGSLTNNYYRTSNQDVKGVGETNAFTGKDIVGAKPVYTLTFSDVEGGTSSTDTEATFTYESAGYYTEGDNVHLIFTPDGDSHSGYSFSTESTGSSIDGYTLTVGTEDVLVATTLDASQFPGLGTEDEPYEIWTPAQMNTLANNVNKNSGWTNYSNTFFKLMADLEYDYDIENNYKPVGLYENYNGTFRKYFDGTFDGNGHTISGVRVANTPSYQPTGIFGLVEGTVKNLTVKHSKFEQTGTAYGSIGPIAGFVDEKKALIENCHVGGDVQIVVDNNKNTISCGGVVGRLTSGTVRGCTSAATWSLTNPIPDHAGGKSPNFGYIVGASSGPTGTTYTTVTDCIYLNESNDLGESSYVGGIVHSPDKTTITRCYHIYKGTNHVGTANNVTFPDNDFNINDVIYENDHLKTFANGGMLYDGKVYMNNGETISVTYNTDREMREYCEIISYDPTTQLLNNAVSEQNGKTATFTMGNKDLAVIASLVLDAADDEESANYKKMEMFDTAEPENVTIKNLNIKPYNKWTTICLPFDVNIVAGDRRKIEGNSFVAATVKTLKSSSYDGNTLTLNFSEDLSVLPARTPCVIRWADESLEDTWVNPVFRGVLVNRSIPTDTDTEAVDFVSSWEQNTLLGGNVRVLYMGIKDNNSTLLYPTEDDVLIPGFNAWFTLNGLSAEDLDNIVLNFDGETPTGINNIEQSDNVQSDDDAIYDLNGRKIADNYALRIKHYAFALPKGVYIYKGKKIVIK
ncbi:MAG: hypothetical protein J6N73_04285 [Prevotella sp.]|nr:hypothetical protein [Prevotella sp.]